jgi:nucleotide-binding universal stress UspA family protein
MAYVLCEVDDSRAAREAVDAAIAFCREHDAVLRLVGVVKDSFFDPPQPSYGERTRRYRYVERALVEAAEAARAAGLRPEVTLRAGKPVDELIGEAETFSAEEIFVGHVLGPVRSALAGKPRVEVTDVSLGALTRPAIVRELKKAA